MSSNDEPPGGRFLRELKNVAKDAAALNKQLQDANQLPEELPSDDVKLLCQTLQTLPAGTVGGAVESLLYANKRIPAWRADCFPALTEDEEDEDFKTIERDGGLDDQMSRLYSSVGSALAAYEADTDTELDNEVKPEAPLDEETLQKAGLPGIAASAGEVAEQSEKLRQTVDPDMDDADAIERSLTDTINAARNVQVEARQPRPVMSLLRKTGNGLKRAAKTAWAVCLDAESGGRAGAEVWGNLNKWAIESLLKGVQATTRAIDESARFIADKWGAAGEAIPEFDIEEAHRMILAGQSPPSAWVPNITSLDFIDKNELKSIAPIAGLVEVLKLDLDRTSVTDLSPLKGLKKLGTLYINYTKVSDLSPISGLEHLNILFAIYTQVKDVSHLSNSKSLFALRIDGCPVESLSGLEGFNRLNTLSAYGTKIRDLRDIRNFKSLRSLNVRSTNVSSLSGLEASESIYSLDVSRTDAADLSPIKDLITLGRLNLEETQVSDISDLSGLSNLMHLGLAGTEVIDLEPLSGLVKLKELRISNNPKIDLDPISNLIDAGLKIEIVNQQ